MSYREIVLFLIISCRKYQIIKSIRLYDVLKYESIDHPDVFAYERMRRHDVLN